MIDKEQNKKQINAKSKIIIIAIVVVCVTIILFSVIAWFLKSLDTKENDKDPKNAPAAATKFMNDTNIDENGNITLGKSIAEWWEELKKNGNKITKYLDSPEELAKLMNAAMALEYPDTREHPDDPIVWEDIDINSKEIQGIVKFKRALKDGGKPITMTYVSPTEFQELISKYYTAGDDKDARQKALDEVLKHFTLEKSYDSTSTGGSPIVEEALKYACSWVGKVPYKSHASGDGNNTERQQPLKEGRASDCSWFVHWVFEHVGLINKDKFNHSKDWGSGGDAGGCPGTIKKGTDVSQASPGDVLWTGAGNRGDWDYHVSIYLGNNKVVECGAPDGVKISNAPKKVGQILHFSSLPTDPTGYFDPDTMTYHSSLAGGNGDIAKVPSLNGMVFIGDSILTSIQGHGKIEQNEGVITMYQSGARPEFFLGQQNCHDWTSNCNDGGYFKWDKHFGRVTNPTGFYLLLGQNSFFRNDRITKMDELVQKIKSLYPTQPIYISSVLHYIDGDGSAKRAATRMNEELKVYCATQANVYYSDILRGYNDNLEAMTESDNDHPNYQGVQLLLKNIKENIVGTPSGTGMTTASTTSSNSVTGEMIVQEAEKYVGKLPYVTRGESLETGADCSGFVWAILKKLGLIDFARPADSGFRDKGTEVKSLAEAQAGDVVCYDGHIGFYDGKGGLIHESNHKDGCKHSTDAAYMNILTIRRFASSSSSATDITSNQQTLSYKVKVATWNESEDIMDAEDPAVNDYHINSYNITPTTIPYQAIVGKYRMPFNYLWTMLVYSQDKNYVFDLAKLVNNSKIEITIHDNYTKTTNIVKDTYTNYKKIYTTANANISYKYLDYSAVPPNSPVLPPERSVSTTESVYAVTRHEPTYTNTHTSIYRNNNLDIALTLADSWFVKYTKEYTYNKPTTSSNSNTSTLDDIVNDPENVPGDFGGHKDALTRKAEAKVRSDAYNISVSFKDVNTEYTTMVINRSTNTENIIESSSYVSSVPGGSGGGTTSTIAQNVASGTLNHVNYQALIEPSLRRSSSNTLQGFCLVGDDLIAFAMEHNETSKLYLADINTMQLYDHMDGLQGHGNTIAYDPVNGDILFPENGSIKLIAVNKTTKKLENKRTISAMRESNYPSRIAYNATHDLFIVGKNVYTREAFYSRGSPIRKFERTIFDSRNHNYAGSTSYGNHVYFYNAYGYGHSTNYIIVCDINTGQEVEIIKDNMPREGEEISFSSDGTLYAAYAEGGPPFQKTDYNYFSDTNIDKSNVTPGVSRAINDIARYNTGGKYTEKTSFEKVFNSHYNARSNILSVTEWLFKALEQNSDTEKMADLTRYLLHKATGNDYGDYGDKQFNYEEYGQEDFISVSSGIYGNTPQEKVWFALRGAGFSEYAVAGAMGNIEAESHFRQDAIEGGSGIGFGLCQWSYGRRTQLENYAKSKGKSPSDIEIQIEFLIGELTPGGGADGYAKFNFSSNYENWKNATSVEQATELYCRYFERPRMNVAHMDVRKEAANKYYNEFHGKTAPSGIQTGNFTQYYQTDYSNVSYGSGSIASCGCGPTSFAMVASTLLKKQITPADAVSWCGNKYYVSGQGTSWSYFNAASEHFGLSKPRNVNSIDEVTNALKSGKLVISSQNRGIFTNSGHFIVLSGISSDGKISVKDPNKNNAINKGYNNRLFTTQEINAAAESYWIF